MKISYVENLLNRDHELGQLSQVAQENAEYPQIFIHGSLVGGYGNLKEYIEQTGFNGSGYTL